MAPIQTGKRYIKSIEFTDGIGDTPARVGMNYKGMQINNEIVEVMPPEYWAPIMLHEEGHVAFNTIDETLADKYMIDQYVAKGGSPKTAIHALVDTLDGTNPAHLQRMRLALAYAMSKRPGPGNIPRPRAVGRHKGAPAVFAAFDGATGGNSGEVYANLSIGSPMKKKARIARKNARNEAKVNLKNAQAQATVTLANQGIIFTPPKSAAENIISSVAGAASSIFAGAGGGGAGAIGGILGGGGGGQTGPDPAIIQALQNQQQMMQQLAQTVGDMKKTSPVMEQLGADRDAQAGRTAEAAASDTADNGGTGPKKGITGWAIGIAVTAVVVIVVVLLIKKK